MNAPIKASIADLGSFEELLSADFIKETLERHQVISENRLLSHNGVGVVKGNCGKIKDNLKTVEKELSKGMARFDVLTSNCMKKAEFLQSQARIIRQNAQRIEKNAARRKSLNR